MTNLREDVVVDAAGGRVRIDIDCSVEHGRITRVSLDGTPVLELHDCGDRAVYVDGRRFTP